MPKLLIFAQIDSLKRALKNTNGNLKDEKRKRNVINVDRVLTEQAKKNCSHGLKIFMK